MQRRPTRCSLRLGPASGDLGASFRGDGLPAALQVKAPHPAAHGPSRRGLPEAPSPLPVLGPEPPRPPAVCRGQPGALARGGRPRGSPDLPGTAVPQRGVCPGPSPPRPSTPGRRAARCPSCPVRGRRPLGGKVHRHPSAQSEAGAPGSLRRLPRLPAGVTGGFLVLSAPVSPGEESCASFSCHLSHRVLLLRRNTEITSYSNAESCLQTRAGLPERGGGEGGGPFSFPG